MTLLLGVNSRGRYFRIRNSVCKCKEMCMTQLNILESRGFFIVLLLFEFSNLLLQLFVQCFEVFYDGKIISCGFL